MLAESKEKKRYYRRNADFFRLVEKMKLWPSRKGILHGIKDFRSHGNIAEVVTHCNEKFIVRNSRKSRAARYLRNKLFFEVCPTCHIPNWKLAKYSSTVMSHYQGSTL